MASRSSTTGLRLAEFLEKQGTRHVFGIPGNHTLELYRGLERSSLTHVTCRHEQGAAFMADGYARVSGSPGVCYLISGPGLANAATAIAQAAADSIPMLVVTTANPASPDTNGRLHELHDQSAFARGITRHTASVTRADDLPEALTAAYDRFAEERPGPFILEIALDVLTQPCPALASTRVHKRRSNPDSTLYQRAAEVLSGAKRPLLVVGGGAIACTRLAELAERLDAPILNTVNAKGAVPPSHPLWVGGSPSLDCHQRALTTADAVLAIGTEFGETDYDLLMSGSLSIPGKLVRIDIDTRQLHMNVKPDLAIADDAALAVDALLDLIAIRTEAASQGAQRAAALRDAVRQHPHYHSDFAAFFACVQDALPDLVLVGDSTRPTYYAAWMYECATPRSYFHSVSGFGTLGFALPAAFGAKLSTSRPVAALIGEGGAQFSLTELATAVDMALPVPVILWCNDGYEEIANSLAARDVETSSTRISSPAFAKIAAAYGCAHFAPRTLSDLRAALHEATSLDRPSLIEVQQNDFVKTISGNWYAPV